MREVTKWSLPSIHPFTHPFSLRLSRDRSWWQQTKQSSPDRVQHVYAQGSIILSFIHEINGEGTLIVDSAWLILLSFAYMEFMEKEKHTIGLHSHIWTGNNELDRNKPVDPTSTHLLLQFIHSGITSQQVPVSQSNPNMKAENFALSKLTISPCPPDA